MSSFLGYPKIGCDAGVDEKEKIKEFDDKVAESRENSRKLGVEIFEKRGFKYPETKNSASSHFNIYAFPAELGACIPQPGFTRTKLTKNS